MAGSLLGKSNELLVCCRPKQNSRLDISLFIQLSWFHISKVILNQALFIHLALMNLIESDPYTVRI